MATPDGASDSSHETVLVEHKEILIDIPQDKGNVEWHNKCCIYKVPKRLRKVKEEAYTPKLISIGPVHHGKPELKDMERLKERYCKKFFCRINKSENDFETIIKADKDNICNCYAPDITLPCGNEFVKMILLDSVFIFELFLRTAIEYENDYILSKPWLKEDIMQDLILLENQLPFFILESLYDQSGCTDNHASFFRLAYDYFFPGHEESSTQAKVVNHFTDLHRYFYYQPNWEVGAPINHLFSATKLDTAGLIFQSWKPKKNELEVPRYLLNVEIKKPRPLEISPFINSSWLVHYLPCFKKFSCLDSLQTRLVLPQFEVDGRTEELFRNLVALEHCHYPLEAYICNYIVLLDFLINSKEDVELLVEKGIIVHSLSSNEAVADMVNKLGIGIMEVHSYYGDVAKELNSHYKSPWNKNMAPLKNVYFRDIWRGTATVVGIVVLLITILNFLTPFVFKHI